MPVPPLVQAQLGTATSVVSTGTYEGARDGIEGRSVEEDSRTVKLRTCDMGAFALDLTRVPDYSG
jgi:hypothetical protein